MISRRRTATTLTAVLTLVGTTAAMTVGGLPSYAGPLGTGETSLSGTTTPDGIGETAVVRAAGYDKDLVVWEGARDVTGTGGQQGIKREIFGQYVSSVDGSKMGSPVTLATLGETDDATQDVVDPALTTRSDGLIVLAFAADPISDSVPIGTPVDTTGFEIYASLIDPGLPLVPVSAVQISDVAGADAAYDQRHPDVVDTDFGVRFVWEGDSDTGGGQDGKSDIWAVLTSNDLAGAGSPERISIRHESGIEFDNTRPRVSAFASTAVVVWEGVDTVTDGIPVRRIWGARMTPFFPGAPRLIGSTSLDGNLEETSPDLDWDDYAFRFNVVWSGDTGAQEAGDSRIWRRTTSINGVPSGSATALTDGSTRDTLPSVVIDEDRNQLVLAWVGRGPAETGQGHHELYTGRWTIDPNAPIKLEQDRLSTVDADVSAVNAEALRPNLDYHQESKTVYAAWARDTFTGGPGVAGRLLAPRVDLSVTATASPTNPSPARDGLNPADPLTFSVNYANKAGSSNATNDIDISLQLGTFVLDETPVTYTDVVGQTPTYTSNGHVMIPSLAPGDSGTVVYHGRLEPGLSDGSTQTATASITTGDVVDDPTPLDNSVNVGVTTDYPPSVVSIIRNNATPTNATSVEWKVKFDQALSELDTTDFVTTGTTAGSVVTGWSCQGGTCIVTAQTGTTDGTIGLRVPLDATIIDTTGKPLATGNLPFDGPEYDVDKTSPTVEVVSDLDDPTNDNPLAFGLEFSEPVTGLTLDELTVVNGTVSQLTGSGDTRSVLVDPSGDGDVKLGVPAGVALDAAENGNLVSENLSRAYDGTRPELVLGTPSAPQNGPFQVTVTPSESVTGFLLDDVTVFGGTASDLTGDGPWAFTVTPDTEGQVEVDVRADAVTDPAGNGNLATSDSVTYDVTRPSVTVDSSAANPTGTSPIPFTLTFDEPVTGLEVDELTVTGGTATMSGSGTTRAVEVTPSGDGKVSVTVPAAVASDAAGNTNTVGEKVTRTYDTSGPAATISTTALDPTNNPVLPVTVTWDESVTGFVSDDVVLTNGTLSDFAGSGSTYTFDVTATADGQVRVAVPAGAVTDAAENDSPGATPLVTQVDTTSPTGEATSTVHGLTNASDVPVTVTYDEPVTGLDLGDLTLVNATAIDLTGSGDTYDFTVEPTVDGAFSVVVPAGAATDSAGNDSAATAIMSWTSDRTSPTADLSYAGPANTNAAVSMALHLSDDASLVEEDFETTNATVSLSAGPLAFTTNDIVASSRGVDDYTVLVTPTADGPFSVKLKAEAFTDAAGNPNTASAERGATYDGSAPTVTGLTAPGSANQPYDVQVVFSEDVLGFDLDSVVVSGGTASDLTGSDDEWGVTVTPSADGPVSVSLPTGTAYDSAGNSSQAAGPAVTTYDATRPTVVVDSPAPAATGTSPIAVSITFSEAVTGFVVGDLEVTNGTPMSFSGAGTSYTVDIVPAGEGDVTVKVPDSAGDDAVGNGSVASNLLTREFDSSRPTVAMTTTAGNPTNQETIPVSVEFSKPVHGFAETDLNASGGAVSSFTQVDPRTWTFTLTPAGDGPVSVEIPENSAASNANNLAFGATLDITSDRTAPVLTLTPPARATIGNPVVFILESNEPVVGLDIADVHLGGSSKPATAILVPVNATRWRIHVSGMIDAGQVTVTLPAEATSDLATNPSARVVGQASWNPNVAFAFLQQPATRWGNGLSIPTSVTGPGPIVFSATSSNELLLPVSQITMTGSGAERRITMSGLPEVSGWSDVVLTADFDGVVRRIPLRFTVGTPGADHLLGTPGVDVILGLQGDDRMWSGSGRDILHAGNGDDQVYAGSSGDLIVGGYGSDVLFGGAGADAFLAFPEDTRPDFDPSEDILLELPAALMHLFAR